MRVDEAYRGDEVVDVDPAEALTAVSRLVPPPHGRSGGVRSYSTVTPMTEPPSLELATACAEASNRREHAQGRTVTEDDRHPGGHAASARQFAAEELRFPAGGDVDGESLPDVSGRFGLRAVDRVTVDRRRARVDPPPRRRRGGAHRVVECPCREDAGIPDLLPIAVGVAASDASAGEVDEEIGAVDCDSDAVRVIPSGIGRATATDRAHPVAPLLERADE